MCTHLVQIPEPLDRRLRLIAGETRPEEMIRLATEVYVAAIEAWLFAKSR